MKITSIQQQVGKKDFYSIFVDGEYSFSVSETTLLKKHLVSGQEINEKELGEFKQISSNDLLYRLSLNYVSRRLKTKGEMKDYLKRKGASPALITEILNKLSDIGLLDDNKFIEYYIRDRQTLHPASKRKIISDLQKKRIPREIVEEALATNPSSDNDALHKIIKSKRLQMKYQDNQKLMQYLARQGFNYGDIKTAINAQEEE